MRIALWFFLVTPAFAGVSLEFTKELTIRANNRPEYVWSGYETTIDADSAGRIYVLDSTANRIVILSPTGDLVRVLDGSGQGPGSFLMLRSLRVLQDNSLLVYDNRLGTSSLHRFDHEQKFIETKSFPNTKYLPFSIDFAYDGHSLGGLFKRQDRSNNKTRALENAVLNMEGSPRLTEIYQTDFEVRKVDPQTMKWTGYISQLVEEGRNLGTVVFALDGSIFAASHKTWQLRKWDKDFKKVYQVTHQWKPKMRNQNLIDLIVEELVRGEPAFLREQFTPEVVTAALEQAALPPILAPILGLIPMEDGRVLVINDHDPERRTTSAQLLEKDGTLMGEVALPPISVDVVGQYSRSPVKLIFRNGVAYALEPDASLEFQLVRYRYRLTQKP